MSESALSELAQLTWAEEQILGWMFVVNKRPMRRTWDKAMKRWYLEDDQDASMRLHRMWNETRSEPDAKRACDESLRWCEGKQKEYDAKGWR